MVDVLEAHVDKINWHGLVGNNSGAMNLIEQNCDKWAFDSKRWDYLLTNSGTFTYDYAKITKKRVEFNKAIIAGVMQPSRVEKILSKYEYEGLRQTFDRVKESGKDSERLRKDSEKTQGIFFSYSPC